MVFFRNVLVACIGVIEATPPALAKSNVSPVALWPSATAPGDEGHSGTIGPESEKCLTKNISVADCKDVSITGVTVPTITPYLVPNADSAVVIAPGGAYSVLAFNREGTDIAAWLNSIGVSAFVLKYRVPARSWLPFGAAPLMDAQRAVRLVRQMADSGKVVGLNVSKIGFMGFSAGGHLTGHMNVAWKETTYPKVDSADDLSCRPSFSIMVYPWESVMQAPVNANIQMASAANVTSDTPPTMLVQAEDDPVHVENAFYYFLALKQKGAAPSELHIYPRGGHGYGRCTVSGAPWHEVCTWPDRGQLFLQTLGAAPSNQTRALPEPSIHRKSPQPELPSLQGSEIPIDIWPTNKPAPGDEGHSFSPESARCATVNVPVSDCKDLFVYNVSSPTITPYIVPNATSAMIIAPGGAYQFLAINREGTDIAAWLNSIGVNAFVLKYRVPGRQWLEFGAGPLMDAQRSMGLVRQMAASGKLSGMNSSSKVGFMGFSAGSHLTGHLNVAWENRTYPHIDPADDLPCKPDMAIMVYPWKSVSQAPVNASIDMASALNVTADTAPTLLIQAEDDPVHVENALYYFLALKQKGATPSELHIYPRGGHGYGRCTVSGAPWHEVCTWPDRGQLFLQTLGAAP